MLGFLNRSRHDRERLIFRFTAGGRKRSVDPIETDAGLAKAGGNDWAAKLEELAKLNKPLPALVAGQLSPADRDARRERFAACLAAVVQMTRAAFGLEPLHPHTGEGVTSAEAVGVLVQYVEFSRELVDDARPFA